MILFSQCVERSFLKKQIPSLKNNFYLNRQFGPKLVKNALQCTADIPDVTGTLGQHSCKNRAVTNLITMRNKHAS